MKRIEWSGLYSESWGTDLVPEAYAHPAKYSRGLIRQIYRHMLNEGMIKPGDTVGDPFGGQAGGALDAMLNGLHWRGVELEPRFVKLGQGHDCPGFTKSDWRRLQGRLTRVVDLCPVCLLKHDFKNMAVNASRVIPEQEAHHYVGNIELWNARYSQHMRQWGTAVLVQGDSRNFAGIVGDLSAVVSSPPYVDAVKNGGPSGIDSSKSYDGPRKESRLNRTNDLAAGYGSTNGQLGSMKEGDLAAIVSSPPYADTIENGDGPGARWDIDGHPGNPDKVSSQASYGASNGQLGRLDGCITSSPFEASLDNIKSRSSDGKDNGAVATFRRTGKWPERRPEGLDYGSTPGNTGNATGDTFWAASREIVAQVYESLKPGAYAAFVCGDFVRKGKRVEFGLQWLQLCESVGFTPHTWAIAWKTEFHGTQTSLFGDVAKQTDRVSFFRRLANEKNPDNAVLNEDVIFVQKPL